MKVLLVHAHPEPTSVTHQLADISHEVLQAQGHEVMRSDLYAMGWKAVFDAQDFPERVQRDRLSFIDESRHAFAQACQTADVQAEQYKLQEADAVIVSDFIAQRLPEEVIGAIKKRQRHNQQRFHAVAMSTHGKPGILRIFDHIWRFDTGMKSRLLRHWRR